MSRKIYKILSFMIVFGTIVFANDTTEIDIMSVDEQIKYDIAKIHNSTIKNHIEIDEEIEKLEVEIEELSFILDEIKTQYNTKVNQRELYSISDNATVIFNNGSKEIFDYRKKVEVMNYMRSQYKNLKYTNTYFDIFNLTQPSELSEDEFNLILLGSNMSGLGYIFEEIEKTYNINGLFILAIAMQESGLGSSNMAITKNNVTGYMAYDSNTGLAKRFKSFEDCLMTTSRLISKDYLTKGGKHYNGTSIFDINIKYCSQIDWSINLISIMFSSIEKIK